MTDEDRCALCSNTRKDHKNLERDKRRGFHEFKTRTLVEEIIAQEPVVIKLSPNDQVAVAEAVFGKVELETQLRSLQKDYAELWVIANSDELLEAAVEEKLRRGDQGASTK